MFGLVMSINTRFVIPTDPGFQARDLCALGWEVEGSVVVLCIPPPPSFRRQPAILTLSLRGMFKVDETTNSLILYE